MVLSNYILLLYWEILFVLSQIPIILTHVNVKNYTYTTQLKGKQKIADIFKIQIAKLVFVVEKCNAYR